MVEMHSGICEDIAGNSTNISPKPEAPGSSPGRRTKNAVISTDRGVFSLLSALFQWQRQHPKFSRYILFGTPFHIEPVFVFFAVWHHLGTMAQISHLQPWFDMSDVSALKSSGDCWSCTMILCTSNAVCGSSGAFTLRRSGFA